MSNFLDFIIPVVIDKFAQKKVQWYENTFNRQPPKESPSEEEFVETIF